MQKKTTVLFILTAIIVSGLSIYAYQKMMNKPDVAITPKESMTPKSTLTIIAFGDSLTAGYGVTLEESYPAILEKKLNEQNILATVINMGASGETTEIALERLDFVSKQNPDLVLLGLGANDMLRSLSPEKAKANLEEIIIYFKERNKQVILLGMKSVATNGSAYSASFDSIYPSLAEKYSLPLIPFFLEGVALNKSLNTGDGIHPNYLGYQKIVTDNILPIVLPYLKK